MRKTALLAGVGVSGALAYLFYSRRDSGASGDVVSAAVTSADDTLSDVVVSARRIITPAAWPYPRGEQYRAAFEAAEDKNGIPRGLLSRQAWQECRFRDDIINGTTRSAAGAVGIMQIVPKWHPEIGEAGALNPLIAIPYAAKYDAGLFKRFGTWELALAAYNWGPGNIAKYATNRAAWPSETLAYSTQILSDVRINV